MHMMFSSLALSLAAFALAAPTPDATGSATTTPSDYPTRADEFTVAFSVGSGDHQEYVAVVLESDASSADDDFLLIGRSMTNYSGTPAYKNGTGDADISLMFDLRDTYNNVNSLWGANAANLGEQYGEAAAIYTTQKTGYPLWTVNGTITYSLYNAGQALFACNRVLNGEGVYYLAFGVTTEEGNAPPDCAFTNVIQNFNLPGGATATQ